ncbi:general secretion pathway protein GspB [Ramlibacter tataouinensis]|uniref:general secretion pathway protein GspB n=1 Tax=Ramlibacter tataouinensis TaxID=94132 RepID=UPI0022F3ABB1|nr:general secretion pathway protein GspB [Ramlibacter tataouinensis]WBY01723.1 general secretion pathway protein GspB [Ramlibacter tataouinensis]
MSYILDALRKADVQRERNRLPGLQAQPHATPEPARPIARGAWLLAGAAAVLGIGGVAAWQSLQGGPVTDSAPPAAPAVAVAAPSPTPQPAPAAQILPPAPPPLPAPAPAAAAAAAKVPAAQRPLAAASSSGGAEASLAKAEPGISSTVPAGAPALAISGGVWSQNPAQRMLIVNGQVFSEGSELAPGVRLQEVKPQRAVLEFRGQRYSVPY